MTTAQRRHRDMRLALAQAGPPVQVLE